MNLRPGKGDLPYWKFRKLGMPGYPDTFRLRGETWIVQQVNREGRPVLIQRADGKGGIHFGTAAAWRGWASGDWRYV